jgi:hypothetical protein
MHQSTQFGASMSLLGVSSMYVNPRGSYSLETPKFLAVIGFSSLNVISNNSPVEQRINTFNKNIKTHVSRRAQSAIKSFRRWGYLKGQINKNLFQGETTSQNKGR